MLIPISNRARASHCQYSKKKKWDNGQHSLKSELLHMIKAFLKGSAAFDSSFYACIYLEKAHQHA
jgi:hypothetical protein